MNEYHAFAFDQHDYASVPHGIPPESTRGGDLSEVHHADVSAVVRVANEVGALLQRNEGAFSTFYQIDAGSEAAKNVRGAIVDLAGRAAGFDIDGALSSSTREMAVMIPEFDRINLGLDNPKDTTKVPSIVRSVQFGSIATKTDWQIAEIVFDNNLQDGDVVTTRQNSILNIRPIPQQ